MGRSPLKVILFVAFVDLASFGLIIPLQAIYAKRLEASALTLGFLLGIYSAVQLIFNPLLGRWSDRVGRRRVLLVSIAGSVFSHALLGVADLARSLPLLFLARTLDGITGANIATAQAYIADVTTGEDRARGMGLFGAAFGVGFIVGPALGAALAFVGDRISGEAYGTSWPAFGAACLSCVALLLVWQFLPESRPEDPTTEPRRYGLNLHAFRRSMEDPRLRELLVLVFGATSAFVLLEVTLVYLCMDHLSISVKGTALVFAMFGVLMAIVQGGLVGRLVRRFGEARLVARAPFVTAIGFVLLALLPGAHGVNVLWSLLLVGGVVIAVGHGLTGPNLNAMISRQAVGNRQGMTLGISQSLSSLSRLVAPPLGGLLYGFGPSWPYLTGAVLLVVMGCFAARVRPVQEQAILRRTEAEASPTRDSH